ncbi:MATE family efflux transporter [Planctomycetota bacterium]
MKIRIQQRWSGPGGCGQVLKMAFPLILSTGAHTLQMFIDRMFLSWHNYDEMTAAMPAGIMAFTFVSLVMGTVSYVNTFVAQYTGADRPKQVGPAVWQGLFLAAAAAVLMLGLLPAAPKLFHWIDHDPDVLPFEIIYFQILCLGALPVLISSTISGFFTGRGRTWTVLYVNASATVVNIVLDYCFIFGHFGFPEWGIKGAGIATIIASVFGAMIFMSLFLRASYRQRYATLSGARFDRDLFRRLIRYGLPNGIQFMLDVLAFALFVALIGRIDKLSLTATNMTFQINMLAFMPMIGLGIAVSALVGQALGRNNPPLAQRTVWSAFYMTYAYMLMIAFGYWFLPELFLSPFSAGSDAKDFAEIAPLAKNLLCFVAVYCLFDTGNIIFSAGLKGAGDTRFVMYMSVVLSWVIMVLPSYLAIKFAWGPGNGLYVAWAFVTAYVCILSVAFMLRFLNGKWKSMRVIEAAPGAVPPKTPEVPTIETEAI